MGISRKPEWRRRTISRKAIGVYLILGVFLLIIVLLFLTNHSLKKLLLRYQSEWERMEQSIYVLKEDVPKGSILNWDMLERSNCYYALDFGLYAQPDEILSAVLILDGYQGMPLFTNMLKQAEKDKERMVDCDDIQFQDRIQVGNQVDIRVRIYEGNDWCLVKDKIVWDISEDRNSVCLALTEEEIQILSKIRKQLDKETGYLYLVTYP